MSLTKSKLVFFLEFSILANFSAISSIVKEPLQYSSIFFPVLFISKLAPVDVFSNKKWSGFSRLSLMTIDCLTDNFLQMFFSSPRLQPIDSILRKTILWLNSHQVYSNCNDLKVDFGLRSRHRIRSSLAVF